MRNREEEFRAQIELLAVEIEDSGSAVNESLAISAPTPWISDEL
jgi:hypothetical protein